MDCEYLWTDIGHLGGGGLQCTVGTEVMLHEWQDMDIVESGHEGGDIHQHTPPAHLIHTWPFTSDNTGTGHELSQAKL